MPLFPSTMTSSTFQPPRGLVGRREWILFLSGMVVYLVTRFLYLEDFPVYFFTDEAAEQVRAKALWENHFFDEHGHLLPVTAAGSWFRFVSIAHYLQLPGWLLFGNSIYAVRGSAVLLSAWGVWGLARTLRQHFDCELWWLTPLVMVTMPAWFLHSRTAFECVYTVVFYIWFCSFYLDYIAGSKKAIFAAVIFGALTLYSYSAGPLIMLATGTLLLLSDAKHHFENRKMVMVAFAFTCLCMVPLALFFHNYPESPARHAEIYSASLSGNAPLTTRVVNILSSYGKGLTHNFWFRWEEFNLRHQIKGLSHLHPASAPFFYLGLALVLYRIKKSQSRAILVMILASGTGAAFVFPEITRNMTFLVPAGILILLGADFLLCWVKSKMLHGACTCFLFTTLSGYTVYLTHDSLQNGALWYSDYGLFGQQWGARELIRDAIPEYLRKHPGEPVRLASIWANSPDYLLKFFQLPTNVVISDIDHYLKDRLPPPEGIFVITDEQWVRLRQSRMMTYSIVDKTIFWPDGRPAFYFVKAEYAPDADKIAQDINTERNRLLAEDITVASGEKWKVRHCAFDIGDVTLLFDGNPRILARGAGAHPYVVEVDFPSPRELHGVEVLFIQENTLTAILKDDQGKEIGKYFAQNSSLDKTFPNLRLDFPGLQGKVTTVRLEMREPNVKDFEKILMHLKEVSFY